MHIRPETSADIAAIHAVNSMAFETAAEANAVDAVRASGAPHVSLVAVKDREIVGHILFSPVTLSQHPVEMMALAPVAVSPQEQRQGIGSALVRAGVERCKELGVGAVVVLGYPSYYPKFGFTPASLFGIKSEYNVPDDVFMALELEPAYFSDKAGTVQYHRAFEGL